MKIVIFQMNFPDAISQAMPIIDTLHNGGAKVVFVNYWCTDYYPAKELSEAAGRYKYMTLSDGGFAGIKQLTRRKYLRKCGDDIDFPRCLAQVYITADYPTDREHVYSDSGMFRHYYGFAWRAERLLKKLKPDYAIVAHGSEPISKILYAKARKLNIPTCLWETSFFKGKMLVDDRGMHFFSGFNRVDYNWPTVKSRKLTPQQAGRLEDFISGWKAGIESKYSQSTSEEERAALDEFIKPGEKILFFPGQLSHDANVITGLHVFDDYAQMLPFIRENLPAGWKLVHKVHPKDETSNLPPGELDEKTFIVRNFSIHELISRSKAVFVHSSNVGLEALMYGKAVICSGRPHYSGKGLTLDLLKREDFRSLLRQACDFSPDGGKLASYLYHIIFEYLIDEGDFSALKKRLQDAACNQPATDISAPFCENYSWVVCEHLEFVRQYNAIGETSDSHDQILANLTESVARLMRAKAGNS